MVQEYVTGKTSWVTAYDLVEFTEAFMTIFLPTSTGARPNLRDWHRLRG